MSVETEWVEGVARIILGSGKGGEFEASYLLIGPESEITIIDTGASPSAGKRILNIIEDRGLEAQNVKHIILTHTHPDHIGGLSYLAKHTPADILVHEAGYQLFKEGSSFAINQQFPYISKFGIAMKSGIFQNYKNLPSVDRVKVVKDGQSLDIEGDELYFKRTGGHSADSMLIHAFQKKATFIGDEGYIYGDNSYSFFFDATGSLERRTRAIEVLSKLSTDILFPSHTRPITKREFPEFHATQELAVNHLNNMLCRVLMDVSMAKLPYIAPTWEKMIGVKWETPYSELNVSYTTAQILMEKMVKEGKIEYIAPEPKAKKRKKKDKRKKDKKDAKEEDLDVEEEEEEEEEDEPAAAGSITRKKGHWKWVGEEFIL